jgi:hypothetical protein
VTQVTSRELELLRQLATFRYLHGGQIEALLFDGSPFSAETRETLARRVLGPLRRSGRVAVRPRSVGGTGGGSARQVYALTDAGRRALAATTGAALGQRSSRGTLFVDHALALADVAIAFRRSAAAHPGHAVLGWEADWELAAAFTGSALRPDAKLTYATPARELAAFVELDRDTERPVAFGRKVTRYVDAYQDGAWRQRLDLWPTILTVTPSVVRATNLRRTTEAVLGARYDGKALAAVTEFRFAAAAHLAEPAGPLGQIWQVAGRVGLHTLIDGAVSAAAPEADDEARRVAVVRSYWHDAP